MNPFYENRTYEISLYRKHGHHFPLHIHPMVELSYVEYGFINMTINNIEYKINEGELAVTFPNVAHAYSNNPNDGSVFVLIYMPLTAGEYSAIHQNMLPVTPVIRKAEIDKDINYIFKRLWEQQKDSLFSPESEEINRSYIQLICSHTIPKLNLEKRSQAISLDLIDQATRYISLHYQEPLTLDNVAQKIGVSKNYLSLLFTKNVKTNFLTYLSSIRVDTAKLLLRSTNRKIVDIAYDCGFDNLRSFNRIFKERTGHTPSGFRDGDTIQY